MPASPKIRRNFWLAVALTSFAVSALGAPDAKPVAQSVPAVASQASPAAPAAPIPSDEIPLVGREAAAVSVASAPNAWGGARTGREETLSDRVVQYDISASLDPLQHRVAGHELLTWRNRSDRLVRSVYLHLYLNAFESSQSTFFLSRAFLALVFAPVSTPRMASGVIFSWSRPSRTARRSK